MEKDEFHSELCDISPRRLVGNTPDDLEDFFLVLGLIFNDLKGILFFGVNLEAHYRDPRAGEISAHAGEFSGYRVQQYILLASLVREVIAFIKKNEQLIRSPKFRLLLLRTRPLAQKRWEEFFEVVVSDQVQEKSTFAYSLMLIRNNVGFHFDQSTKNLRDGFKHFFYEIEKDERNTRAYYSVSDRMKETRFYFIDAAVQGYVYKKAKETKQKKEETEMSFEQHHKELNKMVGDLNSVLLALLSEYITYSKNKKVN